jgi:hypothetical protein
MGLRDFFLFLMGNITCRYDNLLEKEKLMMESRRDTSKQVGFRSQVEVRP